MKYFDILKKAASLRGLDFNEDMYDKFIKYKEMIKEWNEKINLTAIIEDEEIIKKHFIDSINIFNYSEIKGSKKIIDVGTGGGFPGIPIKIINSECEVVLLDSLRKRVNFLNKVIEELGLKNIKAIHGRAEEVAKDKEHRASYDFAVSRAVANMSVLSEYCIPFVKKEGCFIALKGPAVTEEIEQSKKALQVLGGKLKEIIEVNVEETDLKHNLVIVKKVKDTPKKYPRKAGTASKKPIN